ncbi:unnamed protein product [Acanthoscelides obtectus]|uniref:Uncharacterized protein n=1 Tax=Acanthoscelides obtectus TaxID=200917 RepID=A0A9P0KE43_ACAOB|nr:unnamed protein product [Acanthoscelides obtectus]CAK1624772.1 hypothetical protein AOBTE_LOCUS2755 [Acanthoscelides obtectus]
MASKIETKVLTSVYERVIQFNPHLDPRLNPAVHYGTNTHLLEIRNEMVKVGILKLKERRQKLFDLFIQDFLQEERELRSVDLAYINTQP